jgi:uncharacterized membrane protein
MGAFPQEGSVAVMYRGAGTGLMALSVVMAVVGAILTYAVSVTTNGFSIHTVGLILLIAGIVLFVASAILLAVGSSRRTSIREDIRQGPTGAERIEERRDRGAA